MISDKYFVVNYVGPKAIKLRAAHPNLKVGVFVTLCAPEVINYSDLGSTNRERESDDS